MIFSDVENIWMQDRPQGFSNKLTIIYIVLGTQIGQYFTDTFFLLEADRAWLCVYGRVHARVRSQP